MPVYFDVKPFSLDLSHIISLVEGMGDQETLEEHKLIQQPQGGPASTVMAALSWMERINSTIRKEI